MKNSKLKRAIIEEVNSYAQYLIENAIPDQEGIFWEIMDHSKGVLRNTSNETIYEGSTGIILFFISLYNYTRDPRYLDIALKGSRWVENYIINHPKGYPTFYTARTGVIFMFCKLFEATKDDKYLKKAMSTTEALEKELLRKDLFYDFFTGMAGNIFVVAYLYHHLPNQYLLDLLIKCIKNLIEGALISRKGIKWGYRPKNINSLCGISHGASGIAHVFLQIGNYFNNNSFYWLAHQAILYESQYFDPNKNNWKDLRLPLDEVKAVKAFTENNIEYLTEGNRRDINFWTHGAAGIGLVRLEASRILNNKGYWKEAELAIKKTIETDINGTNGGDYIILQGKAGNAELFLEAYNHTKDPVYLRYAQSIAEEIISYKKKHHTFPSINNMKNGPALFYGDTGIAYFLLRSLNPTQVDSILLPRVRTNNKKEKLSGPEHFKCFSAGSIKNQVFGKYFERTLKCLEMAGADVNTKAGEHTSYKIDDELDTWIDEIKVHMENLEKSKKKAVKEIFDMEFDIVNCIRKDMSFLYLKAEDIFLQKKYTKQLALDKNDFYALKCRVVEGVWLKENTWHWNDEADYAKNLERAPGRYPVVIKRTATYAKEYYLNTLGYTLFKHINPGIRVSELIRSSQGHLRKQYKIDSLDVQDKLLAQLKVFLKEGIVTTI